MESLFVLREDRISRDRTEAQEAPWQETTTSKRFLGGLRGLGYDREEAAGWRSPDIQACPQRGGGPGKGDHIVIRERKKSKD